MKIPNISLGFSSKKYSHNKSRDCNTTFPFGACQPVFTEYMLPDSDIKVSAKQLVRLAPLIAPSFARISMKTVTRFVPEHDVIPWSDSFYSKISYNGIVPSSLPYIDNPTLVKFLLSKSICCAYKATSTSYTSASWSDISSLLPKFNGLFISTGGTPTSTQWPLTVSNYIGTGGNLSSAIEPLITVPSPASCDYLIKLDSFYFCFNFGVSAKNFRNICLGLGYSLDMDDFTKVRLSPLLSFFKAYYDTYGIKRFKSYTDTPCFKIVNYIEQQPSLSDYTLTKIVGATTAASYFTDFYNSLCTCYYSDTSDFASIHRSSLQNIVSAPSLSVQTSPSGGSPTSVLPSGSSDVRFSALTASNFSLASLRALTALSRFVNKNSLLGQRLSEYMRLHFGASSVSSIYEDSNFVDNSSMPLQISDVFSTADTQDNSSTKTKGEVLGAYAGKGIGLGDLDFSFHSPCHGYLITLASIVPESGYWQGNNFDLFALNWEQQPTADFDAIGMELTPRSGFVSHNDISNRSSLGTSDLTDKSFGFVPRYSGFKFAKNIVNGDMSRRTTIDGLCPYYLDKILTSNVAVLSTGSASTPTFAIYSNAVPSGSYEWRYVSRYPWLGNYLRIFADNVGRLDKGSSLPMFSSPNETTYALFDFSDSFICQILFNVSVRNCLKPLSLSYDTFNEETDNASKDVSPA